MSLKKSTYESDNGFLSRKLLITVASILLLSTVGVLFALKAWAIPLYELLANSIVTIVLGYVGISTLRATVPQSIKVLKSPKQETKTPEQTED